MRNVEALLNGEPLDVQLLAQLPIKLTYLLQDLESFDKRGGYFSNKFTLPGTKRVNRLFGHFYNASTLGGYQNFVAKQRLRIDSNGINVFNGFMIGESAQRYRGNSLNYTCQILGQNLSWSDILKSTPLTQAVPFTSYTWDENAVRDSWDNTWTDGYVHPLAVYGEFVNHAPLSATWNIEYWELRPWIFLRGMIEKMFTLTGYTLVSSFLQSTLVSKIAMYFNDDGSLPLEAPGSPLTIDYATAGLISEDRNCLDLLKGIIQMFNLYFYTDENTKTVYCEPYNDFFSGVDNWDGKQNKFVRDTISVYKNPNRYMEFSYPTDDVFYVWMNNNLNYNPFLDWGGAKHFNVRYDFERGEEGAEKIDNSFFSGTPTINKKINGISVAFAPFLSAIMDSEPLTPLHLGNPKSAAMNPRICVYGGLAPLDSGDWIFESDAPRTDYPIIYFQDLGNDDDGSNLNYSDCVNGDLGLVRKYYMNRLASLKRGGLLDTQAVLKLSDIGNLDFRKFKSMENVLWQLLEINSFNPFIDDDVKIKMLKNILADATDIASLNQYTDSTYSSTSWT